MTLKTRLTLFAIFAGLSLGLAACTSSASTPTLITATPPPTPTSLPPSDTPMAATDTVLPPTEPAPSATATQPPDSPTAPPSATVMVKLLNVRSGPGTAYPVLAIVKEGDVLTALGRTPDNLWIVVRLADGTSGWCSAYTKYVTLNVGITQLPAAPIPAPPRPTLIRFTPTP